MLWERKKSISSRTERAELENGFSTLSKHHYTTGPRREEVKEKGAGADELANSDIWQEWEKIIAAPSVVLLATVRAGREKKKP